MSTSAADDVAAPAPATRSGDRSLDDAVLSPQVLLPNRDLHRPTRGDLRGTES